MLTSLQNALVKQMRKLHRAKERQEQQLFLLEGTHLLEAALAAGWDLSAVCFTPAWQQQYFSLWEQLTHRAVRLEVVSPEVLEAIATTIHPDGVVAAAVRRSPLSPPSNLSLGIAVETLQDPGNLGTLIRTAAAAGVEGLWVSADSVDLDHPKVLRASAGQWFRLPMVVSSDLQIETSQLGAQGVQIVATLPTAELTYWQADFCKPTLLLLGNEGAGLSPAMIAGSDLQVKIPLATGVESLNVAIAAALILYEAQRQRRFLLTVSESHK
jgi:RNA methyltransferase, TrmH family